MITEEDKKLLLKDLCARLPYGVKIWTKWDKNPSPLTTYILENYWYTVGNDIKPYLRPMSSMNSKEWVEYCDASLEDEKSWILTEKEYKFTPVTHREEFLNSHHFDYRGLILMGLALEATEDMYIKN